MYYRITTLIAQLKNSCPNVLEKTKALSSERTFKGHLVIYNDYSTREQ